MVSAIAIIAVCMLLFYLANSSRCPQTYLIGSTTLVYFVFMLLLPVYCIYVLLAVVYSVTKYSSHATTHSWYHVVT